jgi:tetratricopeptide (TPR) repeat protein
VTRGVRLTLATAVLLLGLVLTGAGPAPVSTAGDTPALGELPKPRELSEAERAAVGLAADYLQRGAEAWWEKLSANAPLRRLERGAALEEIGVRAGPADGASWQLLTPGPKLGPQTAAFGVELASGLDETLVLHLVDEGGWKIESVRISAEPAGPASPAVPSLKPGPVPAARSLVSRPAAPASSPGSPAWLPLALFALGLAGASGAFLLARAGKRRLALIAGAATVAAGAAVGLWMWLAGSSSPIPHAARRAPVPAVEVGFQRLGPLGPLRLALAEGRDRAEIERLLAAPFADPALREVQALWRAQYLLLESNLKAAGDALAVLPSPSRSPLADLLRARLAFRRLQREQTQAFYDAAIGGGLDTDALHLESALGKLLTDQDDLADVELSLLTRTGSRLSEPWYTAARRAATEDRLGEAEDLLLEAWHLEPATRAELFDDPVAAFLLTRPKLFPAFHLGDPEEPRVSPEGARRPLPLPAGARAATCGQALRLSVGGAELAVPGGAALAPEGTPVEDAEVWSRHDEEKALAELPELDRSGGQPGDGVAPGEILQPRRLRLAQRAGRALAEQNRWNDLLALTEPLVADIDHAPASLVRLRAQALRQKDRRDEARQLLIRLAKSDLAGRRPTPGTLLALSELYAATGEYDTAIKLSEKADRQLPTPRGERRRKQLALDRDLAASYASYHSDHFEVRYPKATSERYARGVAAVLEKERLRLARWIPGSGGKPVEVCIFPLRDFYENFGGDQGVIGLFDGKVRVPFAEIQSLHPKLVAILSHELAHAMIAAATHDQAPHWFQEGLAEHVEMGMGRVNPLPDLVRTGRVLAFPTIDPILRGFAEPQLVDLAYGEAAWMINYIETRYGVQAIHRLIAAYAAGRTDEQALREIGGVSPADFDRAFWQWGSSRQAPQTRVVDVERYDAELAAQERRAHREDVRAILRVGTSDDARKREARQQQEADDLRNRMAAWHAGYEAKAAEVKSAVKPIFQRYRQGVQVDIIPACTELTKAVPRMLDDSSVWTSPDADVNEALRDAYHALDNLGRACVAGRDNELNYLMVEADQALDRAARLLSPYGLTP